MSLSLSQDHTPFDHWRDSSIIQVTLNCIRAEPVSRWGAYPSTVPRATVPPLFHHRL